MRAKYCSVVCWMSSCFTRTPPPGHARSHSLTLSAIDEGHLLVRREHAYTSALFTLSFYPNATSRCQSYFLRLGEILPPLFSSFRKLGALIALESSLGSVRWGKFFERAAILGGMTATVRVWGTISRGAMRQWVARTTSCLGCAATRGSRRIFTLI